MATRISDLPTRYEPLIQTFGDQAKTTFIEQPDDLLCVEKLIQRVKSSHQSKIMFILADSGFGKTTFIHSLELYLSKSIAYVERLPKDSELPLDSIPEYLSKIDKNTDIKILNFDGREAPFFDKSKYQTFFGRLNSIIRERSDLVILWPVNDKVFAENMVSLLETVGGKSPFGAHSIYTLKGLDKGKYTQVLSKIMQIANWHFDDAAISEEEVDSIAKTSLSIGRFLDDVQELIVQRFDNPKFKIEFPNLVFVLSSGSYEIRDLCRNVRRADSYYLESSRLLMYTKQSNIADWWNERNKNRMTALPFIISLFNAELVSLSASSVVNAMVTQGSDGLLRGMPKVSANTGSAKVVIRSSELYKYSIGESADIMQKASVVTQSTIDAYEFIQKLSKTSHKTINTSVIDLIKKAGGGFSNSKFEIPDGSGLLVDAVCDRSYDGAKINLEFHYKSINETNNNKIAKYILEKLKEYSINYGICKP